jgi:hypothetical protein
MSSRKFSRRARRIIARTGQDEALLEEDFDLVTVSDDIRERVGFLSLAVLQHRLNVILDLFHLPVVLLSLEL